jgi:hypothetical protein
MLGRLLREAGSLRAADLDRALALQKLTRQPLGKVLIDWGLASPRTITDALAQQWDMRVVTPDPNRASLDLRRRKAVRLAAVAAGRSSHRRVLGSTATGLARGARTVLWDGRRRAPYAARGARSRAR